MSVLRGVLIKQIVFKKNLWSGTKELSIITSVCIKRVSFNMFSSQSVVVLIGRWCLFCEATPNLDFACSAACGAHVYSRVDGGREALAFC